MKTGRAVSDFCWPEVLMYAERRWVTLLFFCLFCFNKFTSSPKHLTLNWHRFTVRSKVFVFLLFRLKRNFVFAALFSFDSCLHRMISHHFLRRGEKVSCFGAPHQTKPTKHPAGEEFCLFSFLNYWETHFKSESHRTPAETLKELPCNIKVNHLQKVGAISVWQAASLTT